MLWSMLSRMKRCVRVVGGAWSHGGVVLPALHMQVVCVLGSKVTLSPPISTHRRW